TEIWPNLYREAKRAGAALLVVNGRISDRAMPRNRRVRWLFEAALGWPDAILAQSAVAAARYLELGAPAGKVRVAGNLKYDFDPSGAQVPQVVRELIERSQPEALWIAASTMPPREAGDVDEDDVMIQAFQQLTATRERLLLVLVPRRPGRFDEAAEKLRRAGVRFLRRSELKGGEQLPLPGVLLVDTIGELTGLFRLDAVVFMGGTLARRGGHNVLEPALFGRPVVVGPHMENFPAIAAEFRDGAGMVEIGGAGELAAEVGRLLDDPKRCAEVGERGRRLAEAKRGATEEAFGEVRRWSDETVARRVQPVVAKVLLWPLARLWEAGWRVKKARAMARRKWLEAPVISVGGIAMGGAGKTPCVLHLAERLKAGGVAPGILTRGYRRLSPEKATVLEPAAAVAPRLTGDEAQLLLRAGVAPLGIGADRYATGKLIESRFRANVLLLDDGFQHWQLGRDLDIVLIDALDPFAGEDLFPLGWLREPLEALGRADVFLITRCSSCRPLTGIEAKLRRWNPRAPVFRSSVVPREWVDLGSGQKSPPDAVAGMRVAAFCGLANPGSFRQTLGALGVTPVSWWEFSDHHHYRPRELRQLVTRARRAGAEVLLTTEKDLMNLPEGAVRQLAPLGLRWLRIGMKIEQEREFLELIDQGVRNQRGRRRGGRNEPE
ncbi:MAG: tetraacyldisaccharide 4'-kinase, partial [bacterium]|nr:tetraacyldisaccharide 4'-kinase [bacterium]